MILFFVIIIIAVIAWFETRARSAKTQVIFLRDRDHSGKILEISSETNVIAESKERTSLKDFAIKRFIKLRRGWNFSEKGRQIRRFLGKEGTGYTWEVKSEPTKINLVTALKAKLGERKFRKLIPESEISTLKDPKYFVTVELEEGFQPEEEYDVLVKKKDPQTGEEKETWQRHRRKLPYVSEETIETQNDERIMGGLAKVWSHAVRENLFMLILAFVCGMGAWSILTTIFEAL